MFVLFECIYPRSLTAATIAVLKKCWYCFWTVGCISLWCLHTGSISVEWTEKNACLLFSLIWENMILMEQTWAVNLKRKQHVIDCLLNVMERIKIQPVVSPWQYFCAENISFKAKMVVMKLMVNWEPAAVNRTMSALFGVIYSTWLWLLTGSFSVTELTDLTGEFQLIYMLSVRGISSDLKSLTEGRIFRQHLFFFFCITLKYSGMSLSFCRFLFDMEMPPPWSYCAQKVKIIILSVLSSFTPLSLVAHQLHYHHLLCCISIWRLLRCGHLWDDLRHGLLRHLHDGAGQADPSGQLGLECECSTCLYTQPYSKHADTHTVCV